MIDKNKYVFIIGAGASIPYEFPSGNELYHIIKNEIIDYAKEFIEDPIPSIPYDPHKIEADANDFAQALMLTEGISIDKYININKRFEEIGIKAIASAIIKREKKENLPIYKRKIEDNWYNYLFQKMIEGLNTAYELLKIYKNKITFVTFNYDRSLEQYLYLNLHGLLKNSGIPSSEITQCIKKIDIIHVYGQVGLLPWQAESGQENLALGYGNYFRSAYENAERVSSLIDVMYSKREKTEEIANIQEKIRLADKILFLGFGFDDDNMKILGFPINISGKKISGTAYEKTTNEIIHYENKISQGHVIQAHKRMLYDCNSTHLLREFLV